MQNKRLINTAEKNIASDKTLSYIHQIDKVLLNSFAKEVSFALTKG